MDDENKILAYNRKYKGNEIAVVFNKSELNHKVNIPLKNKGKYVNVLNKQVYTANANILEVEMEPLTALILVFED